MLFLVDQVVGLPKLAQLFFVDRGNERIKFFRQPARAILGGNLFKVIEIGGGFHGPVATKYLGVM